MIRMLRFGVVFLALAGCVGCAARQVQTGAPARTNAAEELIRQGCYDCLLDARTALATGNAASTTPGPLFEVHLLLALRERELALDASASLMQATALASQLRYPSAERMIAAVRSIPPDTAGRRPLPVTREVREELESTVAAIDASPFSGLFKTYLKLSLQCGRIVTDNGPVAFADEPPLIAYRRAICGNPIQIAPLREVRGAVPRFVETSFFLGRAAMGAIFQSDGTQPRLLFEEAYARFPMSPAITFSLATVYQATNDCRRAEELFTRTLDLVSDHEDARLGRTVCRTYLSRNADAIADATVLIASAASNRSEAYYWRAWNRRRSGEVELARADIDQARALRYNAQILTLAGMIEYDQKDFEPARQHLAQARELDPRECDAPWYLALIAFNTEAWADSAAPLPGRPTVMRRSSATRKSGAPPWWREQTSARNFARASLPASMPPSPRTACSGAPPN